MQRRAFLATSATVLVAGCSSGGETATTEDGTDVGGDTTAPATTTAASTATEREGSATTTAAAADAPEMAVAESGWHGESGDLEFTIRNRDETDVGSVHVEIEWFDGDDNYLGRTARTLPGIGPEKTWYTRVAPETPYDAKGFELSTSSRLLPSWTPDAFELDVQETGTNGVEGVLRNTTDEPTDATIVGIGYDDDTVGYAGAVTAEGIPANTGWRFRAPFERVSPQYIKLDDVRVVVA